MKLLLHHTGARFPDLFDHWVEDRLLALRPLIQIDEAHVSLEHRPEASPAFRIVAHLVVPGPDLRAEAVDHSLHAAFAKVLAQLRARATERAARRRPAARPDRRRAWPGPRTPLFR